MKAFDEEFRDLQTKHLLRDPACISSARDGTVRIGGRNFLNLSSNDYLGLSQHPRVRAAALKALKKYGMGSGSSRLLSGTYAAHEKLERRLARFKKTGAAMVFNSGYAANTGLIPALAGRGDGILSDELNHASIIDGIRLSRASTYVYRHTDPGHLERLMRKARRKSRRLFVITDTVFSMDGDIAPLRDIQALCRRYDAIMVIDDAHATGVIGDKGRGGLDYFGLSPSRVVQMGTLSKAAGCFGAFVAGPEKLIRLMKSTCRSFMYSTSLPPAVAEACREAVDIIESGSERIRRSLWKNRELLHKGIHELGYDTLQTASPIIPVLAGGVDRALVMARHLRKRRIFAPAIRPPTVAAGQCRIRFSVTAAHTEKDMEQVLQALKKLT